MPDGQIVHGASCSRSLWRAKIPLVVNFPSNPVFQRYARIPSASVTSNTLPSRSYNSWLLTKPYSCDDRLVPSDIYNRPIPFLPFPHSIPKPPLPNAIHIYPSPSLFHITLRNGQAAPPQPLHLPRTHENCTACATRRNPPA